MATTTRSLSVGSRIALILMLGVVVLAAVLGGLLAWQLSDSAQREAGAVTRSVAETVALTPGISQDVQQADASARLQPRAAEIIERSDVSFVTIMDLSGIRLTHRDTDQIGRRYLGSTAEALAGGSLTEVYSGTLGPSVRTIVPIREGESEGGDVVALVSVGVTLESVRAQLGPRVPLVVGASLLIVGLGAAGAWWAWRATRRITGSMSAEDLGRMVSNYETVLHSVREGLIVTDADGRVRLYNDEAADLLALPPAVGRRPATDPMALDLPAVLQDALISGERIVEQTVVTRDERVLLVNQEPARSIDGVTVAGGGSVMTLRDRTELQELVGEIDSIRTLSEALRAQTHEHGNRMHTIVSLLELGRIDDATEFITESVQASQGLTDRVLALADEPALAALLLGKNDQARERGVRLDVAIEPGAPGTGLSASDAVSLVGNLIDNAIDAAAVGPEPRSVTFSLGVAGAGVRLVVADSGIGFDPALGDRVFEYGVSTKPADAAGRGVGLALVRDIVTAASGSVALSAGPTRVVVELPGARA